MFCWVLSNTGIGVNEKADSAAKSALELVCPILILNIVSASIFFPLDKVIGMVRLRTSFILSSQSWEIGSPPTGGAGRMHLCRARIGHTYLTHSYTKKVLHFSVFLQFGGVQ